MLRQGQPVDACARVALARELTHALQDQNFDLATAARTAAADPDRARALTALVDGDATRVELAYLATLPAGDQAAVRARRNYSPSPVSYGQLAAAFADTTGRAFAEALAEQGGNPAVDAAFRRPPVLDRADHRPAGVPGWAGTAGRTGAAGAGTAGGRRDAGRVRAGGARQRWPARGRRGRGRAVARRQLQHVPHGPELCTYSNIVLADSDAREQMVRDLSRWVAARRGRAAIVRSADRGIRLRSCA